MQGGPNPNLSTRPNPYPTLQPDGQYDLTLSKRYCITAQIGVTVETPLSRTASDEINRDNAGPAHPI